MEEVPNTPLRHSGVPLALRVGFSSENQPATWMRCFRRPRVVVALGTRLGDSRPLAIIVSHSWQILPRGFRTSEPTTFDRPKPEHFTNCKSLERPSKMVKFPKRGYETQRAEANPQSSYNSTSSRNPHADPELFYVRQNRIGRWRQPVHLSLLIVV